MTPIQERLVKNYATLVMAKAKTIDEVPSNLKTWIEVEIAQREIEILEAAN